MRCIILVALLCWTGCSSTPVYFSDADAGYGMLPDLAPVCVGNNDGQIDLDELRFITGVKVGYLFNPPGTTVTVDPDGKSGQWDLTATEGVVRSIDLQPVASQWFASSFPGADYATVTDVSSGLLGIFKLDGSNLLLLGYASPDENSKTLLVYDAPVVSLRFPVRRGDAWISVAHSSGTVQGQPIASVDTYDFSVDAMGTVELPFLRFANALRLHSKVSVLLPGGIAQTKIQYVFFHECYGELGRMVSKDNEVDDPFTTAAEFRRLTLGPM